MYPSPGRESIATESSDVYHALRGAISVEGEFFATNYAGTISGSEFSASGVRPLQGGGRPCQDGTSFQQLAGVSNLSGRFAADDQSLTATEVNPCSLSVG